MRKLFLAAVAAFAVSASSYAGGYLTNTNQNASYLRNPARLATFELDGAYSNPAGLAWIGEGWHFMFNWQNAAQTRKITSTFAPFAQNVNQLGNPTKTFKGEASAPFIPSLDVAYQKGKFTASMHFGITGGGGKATFNEGLPMFEAPVSVIPNMLSAKGIPADAYSAEMYMNGRQYIYGVQVGVTYKFFENKGAAKHGLSMHLGARMNFASNHYEGYLKNISARMGGNMVTLSPFCSGKSSELMATAQQATAAAEQATAAAEQATAAAQQYTLLAEATTDEALKAQYQAAAAQYAAGAKKAQDGAKKAQDGAEEAQAGARTMAGLSQKTADMALDCDQKGWGIAPIIGLDYRVGNLNIGARYEFQTNMNIENKTTVNTTGVESFAHGVNTPNDIPGILAIGAQYQVLPKWRLMAGWNCYFDKKAGMSGGKQKTLTHNTHEITVGTEVDVVDRLTLSGGFQNTDYGLSDTFQSDLSFSCDSYSLGFGLKVKITKKWTANAAYFWTTYKDYTKASENYNGTGLHGVDVYSRTNKVFGVGITYDL